MNFDAGRFQIGVVELFAVLLPGALLAYVLHPLVLPLIGVARGLDWEAHTITVFLVVSYVAGHFVYLLGAKLDGPIDKVREHAWPKACVGHGQRRGRLGEACLALLWRGLLVKKPSMEAMDAVSGLKQYSLGAHGGRRVMNAFQWSKAVLALGEPDLLPAVQRHEADSKFFRSFLIVLLILFGVLLAAFVRASIGLDTHDVFAPLASARNPLAQRAWVLVGILGLAWLSAVCYVDQRTKGIDLALRSLLTMATGAPKLVDAHLTHAGGVVMKCGRDGGMSVLLVTAKVDSSKWVLPKGHIEPGEHPQAAALREVAEEAGVAARLLDSEPLSVVAFRNGEEQVRAAFYLMRLVVEANARAEGRKVEWKSSAEAIGLLRESGAAESADAVAEACRRCGDGCGK